MFLSPQDAPSITQAAIYVNGCKIDAYISETSVLVSPGCPQHNPGGHRWQRPSGLRDGGPLPPDPWGGGWCKRPASVGQGRRVPVWRHPAQGAGPPPPSSDQLLSWEGDSYMSAIWPFLPRKENKLLLCIAYFVRVSLFVIWYLHHCHGVHIDPPPSFTQTQTQFVL